MINNEKISVEYGSSPLLTGYSPTSYKPTIKQSDYENGYIYRMFAKRANENVIVEIDPSTKSKINADLYSTFSITWHISGKKSMLVVDGIVESVGVVDANKGEIDKVLKEKQIDLRSALPNLTEFWRGF